MKNPYSGTGDPPEGMGKPGKNSKQLGFPDAIEAAAAAAGGGWMGAAFAALVHVAGRRDRFTADEVWIELEHRKVPPSGGDARAMGAVLRNGAKAGICRRLPGEYRASVRTSRHLGPVAVWESAIVAPLGDEPK